MAFKGRIPKWILLESAPPGLDAIRARGSRCGKCGVIHFHFQKFCSNVIEDIPPGTWLLGSFNLDNCSCAGQITMSSSEQSEPPIIPSDSKSESDSDSSTDSSLTDSELDEASRITLKNTVKHPNEKDIKKEVSQVFPIHL